MSKDLLFQKELEKRAGRKLKLRINENRSTMLSVKQEPLFTKVSLHRMFLDAPQKVVEELACYVRNPDKVSGATIREYIHQYMKGIDYSNRIDPDTLDTDGRIYDLKEIYDKLNREYFDSSLDLLITWYGRPSRRRRNTMTFGLYENSTRLIKIHRTLDSVKYPAYFVSFIIYHEMLHHVCPSYYDKNGRHRIHTPEFKKREKEFRYYEEAERWMRENRKSYFNH